MRTIRRHHEAMTASPQTTASPRRLYQSDTSQEEGSSAGPAVISLHVGHVTGRRFNVLNKQHSWTTAVGGAEVSRAQQSNVENVSGTASMDQVPHTLPLTCSLLLEQDAADTVDSREDVGAAGHDSYERQSARSNRRC